MKLCNENSECVYSKYNNSIYCRCLNNLTNCETTTTTTTTITTSTEIIIKTITNPIVPTSTLATNASIQKSKNQTDISDEQLERVLFVNNQTVSSNSKSSFNYDHVKHFKFIFINI